MEQQKVHWSTPEKYSQSLLMLDEATGLAKLHDRNGRIIPPSPDLTIQTGPVAIRKRIYQAAIKSGLLCEDVLGKPVSSLYSRGLRSRGDE